MTSLAERRLGRIVLELAKRSAINTFVESGTYLGETARWASKHFSRVFSIELSEQLFKEAIKSLDAYKNIMLLQGDSGERLPDVLRQCDEPTLLWLDGHYSFGVTAGVQYECPILVELKALLGRKGDIVLIDDAHMFVSPPQPPHRAQDWPLLPAIFDALRSIDPDYYIVLHENAVIAVPKYLRHALVDELFREEADRSHDFLIEFQRLGLWDGSCPLRLHLGCGELPLDGYVNIDFPMDVHNVMRPKVDYEADIKKLDFKNGVIDEVRLHHVFEHFSRVNALSLLIKWHQWLCLGGRLRIETPDLLGSASLILSDVHPRTKSAIVRHLVGDQSAPWAYHVDQWYPERFQRTLNKLGYTITSINSSRWPQEPFLSNIEVIAEKTAYRTIEEQLKVAEQLLWDATVSDSECPTFEVWRKELYEIFGREASAEFIAEDGPRENIIAKCLAPLPESSKDLANIEERLGPRSSKLPINEIHDFNQLSRNRWVAGRAAEVPHGSKVLDVGAGTCLYQRLFSHCIYVSQDFQDYDGFRNNKEGSYGHIDIRSDITSIPVEDSSFDVVLCTEVLEHVPEPILALKELVRIVRPGGRLLLTAPLGSGLHQLPFYFYGGFSPEWYKKFLGDFGCESISISSNGGYFKLLAQECARFKWTMDQHRTFHGEDAELLERLFGEILPRYLFTMDDAFQNHQFTVGYHVSALKKL